VECILFNEKNITYVLPVFAVAHVSRIDNSSEYLCWQNYAIPIVKINEDHVNNATFEKPKVAVIHAIYNNPSLFPYFALLIGDNFFILDIHEHEIEWAKKEDYVTISCEYRAPFEAKLINLMQLSKNVELEITH
jgi:hypothetical protein